MLEFIDFVPQANVTMFSTNVESLQSAVDEMNDWLKEHEAIEIVNVETLLLPNLHRGGITNQDTKIRTGGETSSNWYQFIRLWYKSYV